MSSLDNLHKSGHVNFVEFHIRPFSVPVGFGFGKKILNSNKYLNFYFTKIIKMVILRPMESDQKNEPVCGICKFDD